MLRLAGHEVSLLGRNSPHMRAIRGSGLEMRGLWGERTATGFAVHESATELAEVDYVLVTTKAFDTAKVVDEVLPFVGGARFVTLQNGLGNIEAVAERAGPARTVGGMVIIGFEVPSPGRVEVTVYGGEVLLGRPGGAPDAEVETLVSALGAAGIPSRATDNIAGAVWGKVLYNCALNALGAVLGVEYGSLAARPTWAVIEEVVREAFAVARARGVALPWPKPSAYLDVLRTRQLPATAGHRASMLQDIERGRPTEIEHLNGAVVRLGAESGVPAPVNSALAALVRALASLAASGPGTCTPAAGGRPAQGRDPSPARGVSD
jgi:2-dehydropantoate 2-reductase